MQENPTLTAELPKESVNPHLRGSRPTAFLASVVTLIGVLVLSGGFFFLTTITRVSVNTVSDHVTKLTTDIETAKQNKSIIIADILSKNLVKPSIELKKIVKDFRDAALKAQVRLQGFSIQDDEISTNLIATNIPTGAAHTDPVQTVIKMMRDYSSGKGGVNSFSLEPISSVSGDITARTTSVRFKVVPVVEKTDATDASNTSNQ